MNAVFKFAEKRFAIFALLVFTSLLNCSSYYNASEGAGQAGDYTSSVLDRLVVIMQYGIYGATFLLIILRFKSVIRPAMRDPFIWALIAIIVTSFFWSDFPDVSRKYGFRTLYTTLLGLYLASRYSLQEQLRIVAWALGIGVVFSLLYTLAFPGSGIEQGFHAGAWRGPLVHKNPFARLMVVSALSLLLAALNTRRSRYFVWAVFSIAIALLVLSTSKTAIVIFVTLVILVPLYKALSWSDSLVIPFSITVILVGGSAATWLIGNWDPLLVQLGKDSTLSGRTDIWDGVIEKIWERPWLGYGYQAFWQEGGEADLVWRSIRYKVFQAHNGFLDIGIQIGLLGLLFFVLSVIFAYIRAIKWARLGKTSADLWPIIYITFLPMYNYTESTIVEANSLYWVLFVAITLTLRLIPVVTPTEESESLRRERLVGQI